MHGRLQTGTSGVKLRASFIGLMCLMVMGRAWAAEKTPKENVKALACSNCHMGTVGPNPFYGNIPKLTDAGHRYQKRFLEQVGLAPHTRRAPNRPGIMPSFPLSTDERAGLAAYLASLGDTPNDTGLEAYVRPIPFQDAAAIARGREAYKTVYECDRCHMYEGEGGKTANDLTDTAQKLKPEWMQRYLLNPSMYDPGGSMPPLFIVPNPGGGYESVKIGRDAGSDLADIMAFLYAGQTAGGSASRGDPILGKTVFESMRCANCHQVADPVRFAPELGLIGQRFNGDYLRQYLREPSPRRPFGVQVGQAGRMPNFGLSQDGVDNIARELEGMAPALKEAETRPSLSAFREVKATRLLKEKSPCLGCHSWGADGGRIAPQLMGAGQRLNPAYIEQVIDHPESLIPHSVMPRVKGRPTPRTNQLIKSLLRESKDDTVAAEYLDLSDHKKVSRARKDDDLGAQLYAKNCAMCHGDTGRGDGFNARYLDPKPTNLSDAEQMSKRTDDTLYDVLHVGGFLLDKSHRMPPWGGSLSHDELRALVGHIRTLCNCAQPAWAGDGR